MKKIDLEVHFAAQGWVDALTSNPGYPRPADDPVSGNRRLYYQADVAVLSLTAALGVKL